MKDRYINLARHHLGSAQSFEDLLHDRPGESWVCTGLGEIRMLHPQILAGTLEIHLVLRGPRAERGDERGAQDQDDEEQICNVDALAGTPYGCTSPCLRE